EVVLGLVAPHPHVRREIADDVQQRINATFEPGAFVVGVHYRGTDSIHSGFGRLNDAQTSRTPYRAYADEVRRAIERAGASRHQVVVATDEEDNLPFMRDEFGRAVVCAEDVSRGRAGGPAIHFDATLAATNYQKGRAGLVDCLLLAGCSYLVKGRSNLSDASIVFNPRLPYSLC